MKKIYLFAATALLLAACSNESDFKQEAKTVEAPQAVMFDTYVPNATRAGQAGVMTTTTLMGTLASSYSDGTGFGVFAQYSDGSDDTDGAYSSTKNATNFMWNQKVSYDASAWTYTPLKYWPNETDNDSQTPQATSQHADKLSFFAYAPYVAEVASIYTGQLQGPTYSTDPAKDDSKITAGGGGIEAVISNSTTGDPWVRYAVATTPSESVDLLWGVAPSGGLSYTNVAGGSTSVTAGLPLLNLIKPAKDQKIKFLFKHALARIGMTVVAAVDQIAPGGTLNSSETKIVVESVVLNEVTATKRLKMKGALNLNNTVANQAFWQETSGDVTGLTVTNADELNPDIEWDTDAATSFGKAGVTTTEKDVIKDASDNTKYFMVIPTHQSTDLQVIITYDVITQDAKVSGGYSVVKNVIKKTVTIPTLTNNKAYNLKLVLGLTSVKLDAEVADWEVAGNTEVNLPQNKE